MTELNTLMSFLGKLTIKDVGIHLSNVALLYANPIKTYRKLVKNEYEAYRFFILFILYYAFLVFFIIDDSKWIIPFTILEIILALLPYSFLVIPFLIYRKKYFPNLKCSGLFRLLFVVKIQFGVILILLLLLARWTGMESVYILIDNFPILILIALLLALPLALEIKLKVKLLWIFVNYIFSLLYISLIGILIVNIPDSFKLLKKIVINSPSMNYSLFQEEYQLSDIYLSNDFIVFASKGGYFSCSIFPSNPAMKEIIKNAKLNSNYQDHKLDSLIKKKEKYWPSNLVKNKYLLSNKKIDSIKQDFNVQFYSDFKYVDSLRKHETFYSNRKFYLKIFQLLRYHDSLHKSEDFRKKILLQKIDITLLNEKKDYTLLYTLPSDIHPKLEREIKAIRIEFDERLEYSSMLANIYSYPIRIFYE
jgi:hypothetical protein